jgi:hypothetical protein
MGPTGPNNSADNGDPLLRGITAALQRGGCEKRLIASDGWTSMT